MQRILLIAFTAIAGFALFAQPATAQSRLALVIGNSAYQTVAALRTTATDAGIVSETLSAAGYDVTDLRDLRAADIGQIMRTFLDKVAAGGPKGVAFVYYSGYAAQSHGENYLIPVDAVINTDDDVGNEAFRLKDLTDELMRSPLAARIVVLDAARDHRFGAASTKPVARGLAKRSAIPGTLLAYAAAPGAIATDGDDDYSLYTGALVTQMRQPGLNIEQVFRKVRAQVSEATNGAQTPWSVSALDVAPRLFEASGVNAEANEPQQKRSRGRHDTFPIPFGVMRDIIRHAPF